MNYLSDKEIDRISKRYGRRHDFARAIQAALQSAIEALQGENGQLHASLQSSRTAFEQVCKHRDKLQAKLDELQRQGPVAWRYVPSSVWGDFVLTDDPEKVQIASGYGAKVEPLYAAPKALEPLTDDRIWELAANCLDGHFGRLNFARAIEAAHGIFGESK